ncbi:hypothetical protein BFF78_37495 [Streptomyces fodineus]|uniref:Uncharacterized protein n=1 Tax=Streptomyces fodineus TaxID=1904616 RepID=A0A1D7YKE5_9ACTN|nr:hypothetical protein BFF78_37495 [Streptomyces fodineus]
MRPSPQPDATTRVLLSGVKGTASDHTLAVFVDPYTGKVPGALEQYGSTGALPLRTWIDELHSDLHLGETAAPRGGGAPWPCSARWVCGRPAACSSCRRPA